MWLKSQYELIRPTHFYARDAVLYPSIPKNSSKVWRSRIFSKPGKIVDIDNLPIINYAFAVIRNPAERLISGLEEWIRRSNRNETVEQIISDFDHYAEWETSVNDVNFYAHIMPQTYFVAEYNFKLFEFNKQIEIADYCKTLAGPIRKYIKVKHKEYQLVTDQRTLDIVDKYYSADYKLWKTL